MPEIPVQPHTPQPTPSQKGMNWKKILTIAVVALVLIGLGILLFLVLQAESEPSSSAITKRTTPPTNISTDSARELLEQQLSEEEIKKIKNEESDQRAESNTRQLATAVEACSTKLLSQGTSMKDIYSTTGGCGEYDFLVSGGYVYEIPDNPRPVLKTDPANSVICIWAKGGSIDQNHWSFYATDNVKISLENGGSKQITLANVSSLDLKSDPKDCQKL